MYQEPWQAVDERGLPLRGLLGCTYTYAGPNEVRQELARRMPEWVRWVWERAGCPVRRAAIEKGAP